MQIYIKISFNDIEIQYFVNINIRMKMSFNLEMEDL